MQLGPLNNPHMVSDAQYEGLSLFPSKGIKFLTRSNVSHTAAQFNRCFTASMREPEVQQILRDMGFGWNEIEEAIQRAGCEIHIPEGAVGEAWDNGIRFVSGLADQHESGTPVTLYNFKQPLTDEEYIRFCVFAWSQKNKRYDWTDVIRFVTRKPGQFAGLKLQQYHKWFCSAWFFACAKMAGREMFVSTEAWEVFPGMVHRSPLIDPNGRRIILE